MQCIVEIGSPPGIKEKKCFRKLRYVRHLLVSKYIHLCKSAFCAFVCVHEYVQDSWGRCLSSGWVRAALNHCSTDTPHHRVSHHVLLLRQKEKRGGQKPRGHRKTGKPLYKSASYEIDVRNTYDVRNPVCLSYKERRDMLWESVHVCTHTVHKARM